MTRLPASQIRTELADTLNRVAQDGERIVLHRRGKDVEFVVESTGRNIYDARYDDAGGSKANRIRAFWEKEPNHLVGKLVTDLFEYCRPAGGDPVRRRLFEECERIATRLLHSTPVDSIDAITPEGNERGFEAVARAVRDSIEKNEPDAAGLIESEMTERILKSRRELANLQPRLQRSSVYQSSRSER